MIKITIKDHCENIILTTTDTAYKQDLSENKDKLTLWWRCVVEYEGGKILAEFPKPPFCFPRRVIEVNGRWIYADYNFEIEGEENVYEQLLRYLNEDFDEACLARGGTYV